MTVSAKRFPGRRGRGSTPPMATTTSFTAPDIPNPIGERIIETIRVIIVAGVPCGAILVGLGSRLCMFILRLTSSDKMIGIRSDDDFVIGRFTLGGTYKLLTLGAAVGLVGAGAYLLIAPRLIGPTWFRHLTVGLASGAVGGAMLIHPNGIDFTRLTPTWLAIGLFIALPGVFGAFVGPTVKSVAAPETWTRNGKRRWALPVIAVACFPPVVPVVIVVSLIAAVAVIAAATITPLQRLRRTAAYTLVIRAAWLFVAIAGLRALVSDIQQIT
jgi:hypothetical protein